MPVLWLGLVLAGPVVLVDNVSSEKEVPKTMGATLDPLMCNQFEKSFKSAKLEVKCRADIEAILKLRAMQSAVGSPTKCTQDMEACAAQTAKLAHCTHVLVSNLSKDKSGYILTLSLVDTTGKVFESNKVSGSSADALLKNLSSAVPKLVAALNKP